MPVARSVSASQLSREIPVSAGTTPTSDAPGPSMLHMKAHTLDRFSKPGLINGRNETTRRKRSFMSFRLNKKGPKRKEGEGVISESSSASNNNGNSNSGDSQDGSDSSSATSVKPKRRHLNRMGSFVRKVASRVQVAGPVLASVMPPPPPPRPKTASSLVQTEEKVPNSNVSQNSNVAELINSATELPPLPVLDYISFDEKQVPAVIGLRNHGNTCFINAIVQCLNHTDVLAEYFVLDAYKQDLRRCNRIGNRKMNNGSRRGEMTEQVAGVLKSLWSLRYVPDVSLALKACVDRHEAAYRGSSQHDAAEFLMFLLGKVHDDLNTASKRKYKKIKSSHGRPDEVVASETLNNHLRCNSSFVQDIFQAQFRSSLRCPRCQCESNTFDPFMCVSLPIPHVELMPIFVTVVYLNQQPKQVCLGVSVVCGSSFGELRGTLAQDCGLELASLIIVEVDGSGFHRTFADDCSVDSIGSGGSVHAIELPVDAEPAEDQGPFVLVTWLNVVSADHGYVRFGGVYQSQVARDIPYRDLQKLLLKEMTTMVTTQTLTSQQEEGVFQVRVCEGSEEGVSIASSVELPLYSQSVDQALALCCPHQPQHLKLLLLWQPDSKQKYIVDDVDHVERHSSVEELKRSPPQPPPTSLADCLRLHSSAEQLSSGDAWHCPSCDRKEQGVKRLMLWSAPQILVLHLKRFRQNSLNSNSSSKLNTFVSFPLTDVDISEYVAQRSSYTTCTAANNKQGVTKNSPENCKKKSSAGNTDDSKEKTITTVTSVSSGVWSPWRKPKRLHQQQQLEDKHVYDLYAVCNHHGKDLQGGHYTAVCHNPSSGEWYEFDDSRVKQIPDDKVVTQDAYLLFYQRRQSNDGPCATTALQKEHWSYRIPRDCLPASLNPPIAKQATAPETVAKSSPSTTSTTTSPTTEPLTTSTTTTDAPPAPTSPPPSDPTAATTTPTPPSAAVPAWKPFERGRSYGTLPGHGRSVLQSQDSTERENSSDTEAPLAIQDSPIKKRISDVQERRESEEEDTEGGSPMDTSAPDSPLSAQINGLSSQFNSSRKTECVGSQTLLKPASIAEPAAEFKQNSVMNGDNSNGKTSDCNLTGQTSSPGSKTVYISRNQAVELSKTQQPKCSCLTKEEGHCKCKESSSYSGDAKKLPAPKNLGTVTSSASSSPVVASRSTPDVLIQPASPAVLAAHKKSVITVTLRQRSPSTSSQPISRSPSTCSTTSRASRASLVSRASVGSHKLSNASSVSSFSPETLASIITVNGVSLADNEELSAEFANSLAVSAAVSNAGATHEECCKYDCNKPCGCGDSKSSNKSVNGDSSGTTAHLPLRSSHVNKTASYVHVNCPAPSASPRCSAGRSSRAPFSRSPNGSGRGKPSTVATANGCTSSAGSRSLVVSTNGADSVYLSHSFKNNQCNPSIISKNSRNTARSSVESVPSSKIDSFNGTLSSTSDGCRCHRSNTSSSNSKSYNSDNVGNSLALRNSCGNFTNLKNGEPGCTGGRCSCRYKDSVSCGPGRVNRHSSGSLDSSHVNVKVSSRERCGSECLGEKPTHLDKNTRNRSYIASCDIRTCTCRNDSSGVSAPVTCSAAIQRSAASLACCSAVPDECTCGGAVRPSSTVAAESSV